MYRKSSSEDGRLFIERYINFIGMAFHSNYDDKLQNYHLKACCWLDFEAK